MPSILRKQTSSGSSSNGDSDKSRRSSESYGSHSTTPTSPNASPRPSDVKAARSNGSKFQPSYEYYDEDLSPATSCYPRSSVDTYASTTASEEDLELEDDATGSLEDEYQDELRLPIYRQGIVDTNVRPSTPQEFAKLFPSLNRLSIRHDEFTADGNMNLRIDTAVPGRRRQMMQLFHLRMYDLGRREFSLRRYCRDSGREVCNSKRKFIEPASPESRPNIQRSVSSAIKTLGGKPSFKRTNSGGSLFSGSSKRPSTSHSACDGDDEFANAFGRSLAGEKKARPQPTNTIKLEFSNYARVDVERRGGKNSKRYEFEWWGHRYSWKRLAEKHLDVVRFHLLRDGKEAPIAHIVPEVRTPNQALADEQAGGWIPPCFMWINDATVLDAVTDVADVIMATGLIALVDDCIKERLRADKKVHRIPVPLTSKTVDVDYAGPKAFMQHMFHRRNTADQQQQQAQSPLRYAHAISAY